MSHLPIQRSLAVLLALGALGCAELAAPSFVPTQAPQTVGPVPPTWTAYNLGVLPGHAHSIGHDLNRGMAVGVSYVTSPLVDGRAVWWDSAQAIVPTDLGLPAGGVAGEARAVNAGGEAAGTYTDGTTVRGFIRSAAGAFTTLSGPPGALSAQLHDINDAGMVVGVFTDGFTSRAFRYSAAGGYVDLHPAGMAGSLALGVNNQGNVVGWVLTTANEFHAALWLANGTFTDLGGVGVPTSGFGRDINDNDNLVGSADNPAYGFAQNISGSMVTLPGLAEAMAISARNRIVGKQTTSQMAATMLGLSGAVNPLPTLAGASHSIALGVNPCGHVVGWSLINGAYRATGWIISACD